ncbi:FAD-dependent oxidoreductase [Gordonia aichiensis]|uniref:Putative monooxygenase n=1 Tax=Gordonia aichiensis NBRC 108223 TaxID=1220583 RepID=L7KN18_9ACTN|nr:NAD(P)/FAD-dependent oxidoreductase [Gordonia aichiensis]GAC49357.1 putative monooxygenase [Gordonia aichiensis NBRC 108223]
MNAHVAVIGAQPVGLCTALGLALRGIQVTLVAVESDDASCLQFVHNWSVLPGLDALGVLTDAREAGSSETHVGIRIAQTGETIDLDLGVLSSDVPFPFNLHLEDARLSEILLAHLLRLPEAEIVYAESVRGVRQDESEVVVDCASHDGPRSIRVDWLVAADGTNSTVRRLLGVGFPGFTWRERSVSMLVTPHDVTPDLRPTTFLVGVERSALLQKADSGRWLCAFTESMELPEASLADRLAPVTGSLLGAERSTVHSWAAARMHHRSAANYRVGRVLLTGAAAHVTNRLVGHSSITGFFDSFRVVEALEAMVNHGAPDCVLDNWAHSRRRVFLDDVAPLSSSRKQLLSLDREELEIELDYYRGTASSPEALREMLLVNLALAGDSPLPG